MELYFPLQILFEGRKKKSSESQEDSGDNPTSSGEAVTESGEAVAESGEAVAESGEESGVAEPAEEQGEVGLVHVGLWSCI